MQGEEGEALTIAYLCIGSHEHDSHHICEVMMLHKEYKYHFMTFGDIGHPYTGMSFLSFYRSDAIT